VAIIGDFNYYWIVDSMQMEMQRLEELYAATSQVGFIGRAKLDAQPVLAEAFKRVKLA
jgi:HK97 family phage major capsid protein